MSYNRALWGCIFLLWAGPVWAEETTRQLTNVETLLLAHRPLTAYSTYMGHLEPQSRVMIGSEVAGAIERADFSVGDQVKKGQMLLQIETKKLEVQYKLARSNAELAKEDYQRELQLFAKKLSTRAQLNQLKNRMEVTQYQMELGQLDLKKSQVTAPFDGVISKKMIDQGEYIGMGKELVEILDLSQVKANVNVPEREVTQARREKKVEVSLDAVEGKIYEGQISSVSFEADQKSRSFRVEVEVPNPNGELRSGMLARVRMVTKSLFDQMIVPRDAVLEDESGSYVFLLVGEQVKKNPIK